jgi:hypothetical protein
MGDANLVEIDVSPIIEGYLQRVRAELAQRIAAWPVDITLMQAREVLGGLMARQVSLATQLAGAPSIWNGHLAPVVLRTMTDAYITFAWIWKDAETRAAMYIMYGLGQLKLQLEHLKAHVRSQGRDAEKDPVVLSFENALNAERMTAFTEVNIGSWSGTDTRSMAEETGCLDLYRFAYAPFSQATHNMWPHIASYNLDFCASPLHRRHRIPVEGRVPLDVDYLYRAAKYVEKTFKLFDRNAAVDVAAESAFAWVANELMKSTIDEDDQLFDIAEPDAHKEDPTASG